MQVGDKLPERLGLDQNGQEVLLSDFAGKKLVLCFYPKEIHQDVKPKPAVCGMGMSSCSRPVMR